MVRVEVWYRFSAGKMTAGLAEINGSLPPEDDLIVTCALTACTPGSAPGLTLSNDNGRTLPFYRTLHVAPPVKYEQRTPGWTSTEAFPPRLTHRPSG